MDCIFCQIRDGKIPSTRVYEDALTLAFMDINPVNDGHLLVVPKAHVETIFDMSAADVAAVSATAKKMAEAMNLLIHQWLSISSGLGMSPRNISIITGVAAFAAR